MKVWIDKARRIVIPKLQRERLGFKTNAQLVAIEKPEGMLLKPVEQPPSMVNVDGLWVYQGTEEPGTNWEHVLDEIREDRIESILKV